MKVLLVNGSPRKDGCTYTALSEVEKSLNEEGIDTELVQIGNKGVRGCIACNKCIELHKCAFNDIVNDIALKMQSCDGFIVGSPVHYAAAGGDIASMLDRLFFSGGRTMAGKVGSAVVSARRAGTTAALEQLNKYFMISNMILVGSQYWNMVHGMTAADVAQDIEGLQTMRTLGKNMAWLLKSIQAGKDAGLTPPQRETKIHTHFIR